MNPNDIPPRFREEAFRRYEAIIKTAIDILPSELDIDPRGTLGLSPETVTNRLRDAMRSLKQYRWTTSVDMVRFLEHFDRLEVARKRANDSLIVVRLKEKKTVQTSRQLDLIEVPLGGTPHENQTVIEAVLNIVATCGTSLGKAGLSGIRLKNVDEAHINSIATTLGLTIGVIPEPPDVILL